MIVLDTHIWVWWVHGAPQLPQAQAMIVQQHENTGLGISAISCWEVAKLVEKGRLTLPCPIDEWMRLALGYPAITLLPLEPEIAIESTRLPGPFHSDPADQIIVATARIHQCPVVTIDRKISAYPHVQALSQETSVPRGNYSLALIPVSRQSAQGDTKTQWATLSEAGIPLVTSANHITAEGLWRMPEPDDGSRYELLAGKLIQVAGAGGIHGACCAAICSLLHQCAKEASAGYAVSNNTGVLTERDPDSVLAPDLAYWSRQRLPEMPEGFVEVPPDLAVEVVSPGDSQSYVHRKVLHYLDHGVASVWVVDPKTRTLTVYRSRQNVRILAEADEITGGDVLPGFSCRVGEFFE